jgi:multicomponent Na+:H+ antiporter subunit F
MNASLSPAITAVMLGVMLLLAVALAVAFVRVVIGPSAPDRVVALDLMSGVLVGLIAVYSALTGESHLLRVAMALALISFLGTVAVANYLEKGVGR